MGNPHVLVIPYPSQGHVIPMMKLSQCLVKQGCRITFVNTEYNHKQLMNASAMKDGTGNGIRLVSVSDVLESSEERKQPEKVMKAIMQVMPQKVEELIDQVNESDDEEIACVLADYNVGWALEIADKKGIRRAAFRPNAATLMVLVLSIQKLIGDGIIDKDGTPTKKQMIKLSPNMPAMNTADFMWTCTGNMNLQKTIFKNTITNTRAMKLTNWLLCNSAYDLEPAAFTMAPEILPIGPIFAGNPPGDSAGNFWAEDFTCLKWLDQQPPQSVIYVAFGSSTFLEQTQFHELALGLELSNRPFLWVVRPGITYAVDDAYPKGFRHRVGGRGKIVDWAPQLKILDHPSVACFIIHCGWNSTMAALSKGGPLLCWNYIVDQFHNESYICDTWKVGLRLNRDERGIITPEEIKTKVEELVGNGKYSASALGLKELVMSSIKEGGSSYNNLMNFILWLKS
ncbi:UDP-glycosyltransferase 83A1-like [Pistacia vera]|uniref:UDP-glycosyltransferase 83A1-like n=1 Tax=Pistacia vera TaxID=55513 RepID=UPI001262DA19|nr:UDP-glycosyltransferase 83A1-like [Pistacia vera]